MVLDEHKGSALARLRSASGHISVGVPESIRLGTEELRLRDAIARARQGELSRDERDAALVFLGDVVSGAEERIRGAETIEEVDSILHEALGARRAIHILRGGADAEGNELEDARRWHRYTKEIG